MNTQVETTWKTLKVTYGLVPIIAGLDKFTNFLVDWKQYASPLLSHLPIPTSTFMMGAGVVEIFAGGLVLSRHTRAGGYLVSAWLAAIAVNLLTTGHYFDVAVRDLVMAVGAFSLAKLSEAREAEHAREVEREPERPRRTVGGAATHATA